MISAVQKLKKVLMLGIIKQTIVTVEFLEASVKVYVIAAVATVFIVRVSFAILIAHALSCMQFMSLFLS
jgi:hypothetical protein